MEPFLFRFKQSCSTKMTDTDQFHYDGDLDMVMVSDEGNVLPAIHHTGNNVPGTKKADIEKGEDAKDTIMWK